MQVTLILSVFFQGFCFAGISHEEHLAGGGPFTYLSGVTDAVLTAEVLKVEPTTGTNANPPRVTVKILEVLRGDFSAGDSKIFVWAPAPHDVDWVGKGAKEVLEKWRRAPLKGPEVGAKFLLAVPIHKGQPGAIASSFFRLPYSDQSRRQAMEAIQNPTKNGK